MTQDDRETPCTAPALPPSLAATVAGYMWARDTVGESGGAVYRLHGKPDAPELYLKYGRDGVADDVSDEMLRLQWLGEYLPVPRIVHVVRTPDAAWLLMSALPGRTAYQAIKAMETTEAQWISLVDALAGFLRRLHAIPVHDCPFTSAHGVRLARAKRRIDAGLVDEDDFDDERAGWTAGQVWEALTALLPLAPDPVVTHGDYSLDNLFVRDGEVVGCIDVGRVGIADRYQDLAIAWNCLGEFGAEYQARFLR